MPVEPNEEPTVGRTAAGSFDPTCIVPVASLPVHGAMRELVLFLKTGLRHLRHVACCLLLVQAFSNSYLTPVLV